jgi:hypothetical protein
MEKLVDNIGNIVGRLDGVYAKSLDLKESFLEQPKTLPGLQLF